MLNPIRQALFEMEIIEVLGNSSLLDKSGRYLVCPTYLIFDKCLVYVVLDKYFLIPP
jgi:hypothetical protein